MSASAGARILADSVGPGGTAAIVVLVLVVAVVAIFLGLLGSLRRLRRNASDGTFAQGQHRHPAAGSEDPVTHDPGGPGGAGA